jgi:hypothetical protein
VTIEVPQPIGLSRFTPFLPHPGGRVGFFFDPPGSSFVVEGGVFEGTEYSGVVFTPSVPTSGTVRIDLAIANPLASGGPAIVLVAGEEGAGAPDIADYPGAAKIAEVSVTGHASGVVLIRPEDILDLRPILATPAPAFKMLFVGRVRLGSGMQTVAGSTDLLGDSETYPFDKVLTVRRAKVNQSISALAGHRYDWIDLEMPYYIDDFHLVGSPYDTHIGVNTTDFRSHSGVGLTWRNIPSETQDDESRDLPLIRISAAGSSGRTSDREYFTGDQGSRRKYAFWQFQAWGRV